MSRVCTVCDHPERRAIDEALVGGEANTKLSSLFAVSEQELRRHRENHPPAKLVRAQEVREHTEADALMRRLLSYEGRGAAFWTQRSREGLQVALGGIREARRTLELLARVAGELNEAPRVNIQVNAQWVELRTLILTTLDAYPQAKQAVARAPEEGSGG